MTTTAVAPPDVAAPGRNFAGFSAAALTFLRDLAANNDPAWFKPRKDTYDTLLRGPAIALAADILTEAARMRIGFDGDPIKAVFRLYRDVRFSADKRPYKTHVGIALTRSGRKADPGLLYIHIEPDRSFMAAGFYHPERDALARLRHAIIRDGATFRTALRALDRAKLPLEPDAEAAQRLPAGCEEAAGTDIEPFVKVKSLIVRRTIPDREVGGPGIVDAVLAFARDAKPLLAFGWGVLDGG